MNYINHDKAKFKIKVFNCLYKFFDIFLQSFFFHICIKMSKNSHLNNSKKIKKNYKESNNKSNNMVLNVTKISQKMKNRSLLSKEKKIVE